MSYRHVTIVSCLALVLAFAAPQGARATFTCPNLPSGVKLEDVQSSWIALQLPIPNVTLTCTDDNNTPTDKSDDVTKDYVKDVGAYIGGLYKYFVGVIGIIAAVMVFYGGLQWLTAGGNASRVKNAKETIFAALIAILIAFGSYTLLYTINPKLVVLNPPVFKVADTFLTSFDNSCSTTKVCLSGTNVGNTCTTDAACPGASTGACGLPIEDLSGNNITTVTCGTRYKYKKIIGVKAQSDTCVGSFCASGMMCGKVDSPRFGVVEGATCADPERLCESLTEGIGANSSDCAKYSSPELGKCEWDSSYDACLWNPRVQCSPGWAQVGCGECNTQNSNPNTPVEVHMRCSSGFGSTIKNTENISCTANSEQPLYIREKDVGGKFLSLCCKDTVTGGLEYVNNTLQIRKIGIDSCQSGGMSPALP